MSADETTAAAPLDLDMVSARARDAEAALMLGNLHILRTGAARRLAREDVPALVAEVRRLRAMIAPPCPECRDGKHGNCDGSTWDLIFDEDTECPCAEGGHA